MPRRLLRLVSKRTPEPRPPGCAFSPENVVWAIGSFCAVNRKPLAASSNTGQTLNQAQFAGPYVAAFPPALVTLLLTKVGNAIGLDSSTAEHFAATINQFKGRVTMLFSQKDMIIDSKCIPLSPGMNISAEIKTGQRRVIEYFLSPVQRASHASLNVWLGPMCKRRAPRTTRNVDAVESVRVMSLLAEMMTFPSRTYLIAAA
jgi:hypothetical protein